MRSSDQSYLPSIIVLDDLFGRNAPDGRNEDRENLCAHFLWEDITGDQATRASRQKVPKPTAQVFFSRAQTPSCASIGDSVENSLSIALDSIRSGWTSVDARPADHNLRLWAMLLLDLCFYTGNVTESSNRRAPGMPEGRPEDNDPRSYFGLVLLDAIHREFPDLPIYILSSKQRDEVSLEFSRRGALGFIARDDLRGPELLEQALWQHGLLPDPQGYVVGSSLPLLKALREARRAGHHRENLLIRGERGTGKELLARYIHRMSGREERERPFVAVNSAVFTPHLFASELFGIEPRTATGVESRLGLVEMAHGGDLFLDEIADMPQEVQAAFLRVLQERQITRVGSRQAKNVDVRFLSATNADLEDESGGFRSDLLDRLRLGGTVWLPLLRDRASDIPLLVERFVRAAEAQRKGSLTRDITHETLETLCGHSWPGNIRELRSVIFDAVNRFPDVEYLVPEHLRLESGKREQKARENIRDYTEEEDGIARTQEPSLGALLSSLTRFQFNARDVGQWSGKLGELQQEHSRLTARMLAAAIEATKRRTPEMPLGIIQIHPAAKLITGDTTLTASKAADLIKRILGPLEEELEGDLREALAIAVRLRPRSAKTTTTI
jgi:DNA-binding NtrC family response regulator